MTNALHLITSLSESIISDRGIINNAVGLRGNTAYPVIVCLWHIFSTMEILIEQVSLIRVYGHRIDPDKCIFDLISGFAAGTRKKKD